MSLVLFILALSSGFCSGLLGIGGAVLLIPLLVIVPPLCGVGELGMGAVSGISMLQVLSAAIAAGASHWRSGFMHGRTVLLIGVPMAVFTLLGAAASSLIADTALLLFFGLILLLSLCLLHIERESERSHEDYGIRHSGIGHGLTGAAVGLCAGLVGAGGGFLLLPAMIGILKIPTRIAVGSSLGIILLSALFGSIGKIATLQVEWSYLIPVIAGSIPASIIGSRISHKLKPRMVERLLFALTLAVTLATWIKIALLMLPSVSI